MNQPRARKTDPKTSHDAARSVTGLNSKQKAVYRVLKLDGPSTLQQLVRRYTRMSCPSILENLPAQSESGIRTRCHELVVKGKVVDTGQRSLTQFGREAIVWRAR